MTTPTRILITGANGQLGRALAAHFENLASASPASILVQALDRSQCDLESPEQVRSVVQAFRPHVIVNAAAHTAVDQAETDRDRAWAINASAPGLLAHEAKALGACLIHYSTDYVFEGEGDQAWVESDACKPRSVYGASKLAGEQAIAASGAHYMIFRTSWVYAAHGANFMLTMLKLASDRETLSVIDDQWGVPTWVGRIVAVTEKAVNLIREGKADALDGIYHLCPAGETTWYRYAAKIFELAVDPARKLRTLTPITSAQYEINMRAGAPERIVAKRPHNSRMNCGKLEKAFGLSLPSWEADLAECLGSR